MKILSLLFFIIISFNSCAQANLGLDAGDQDTAQNETPEKAIAFPGAEGFGKDASGGRGGKVYVVTNLNDDGPGSLRDFIRKKEPRIIIFAVSGTIALNSNLDINYGNLTIAGQTAPGDGICIKNYPVKIKGDNVIIRYMRFRLGDEAGVQDDALNGTNNENIIIDHCSMSWATDECASFYRNKNFTLQWCIISESLNASVHEKGDHGYGGIWGGINASFHHNLIASHSSRMPRFSGSSTTPNPPDELVDFRNNVVYNWKNNNTYGGEKGRYNMVNNYYKSGPSTINSKKDRIVNPSEPFGKFYIEGNVLVNHEQITQDNWKGVVASSIDSLKAGVAFNSELIIEHSALEAYELVLNQSGASLKRDAVDVRVVEGVRLGNSADGKDKNGIIDSQTDVNGWPELKSEEAPLDSDADGMPDAWELLNGLDPNDLSDSKEYKVSKSYTNIEVYINSLIE